MKLFSAAFLLVSTVVVGLAVAQTETHRHHVIAPLADAQWGPAPPMLPAGAQIAVLAGDPTKAASYAVRLKFPPNYTIPAHSHPTDENVVVVSGEFIAGVGDVVNKTAAKGLGVGGFAQLPAGMNHFAFTRQETTIVLFGIGPVEFKYVNPSDDPRNARRTTDSK